MSNTRKKTALLKWGLKQSPILMTFKAIGQALGVSQDEITRWMNDRYLNEEKTSHIEKMVRY